MLRRVLNLLVLAGFVVAGFVVPNVAVTLGDPVAEHEISVNARDLQLLCPGAFYRSGGDEGSKVDSFSQQGSAALQGSFTAIGQGDLSVATLNSVVVGQKPSGTVVEPLTLTAKGSELQQGSTLLNANQLQLLNDSRAAGLFAAPCLPTANEAWLMAADTSVGRESLLILSNPGSVNATVSVELFGTSGKIATAGQGGISVPANSTTVIPVASLAPGLQALVIHVLASSSAVTATLQQKTVRGLVAAGGDLVVPSTELAQQLVIPGLFVRGVKDASKLIKSNADYADLVPTLRVFVPKGQQDTATVTAQVVGETEKDFGTVVRQTLTAGSVTDIPLFGLQDGNYAVFISSDAPIRAGLRLSRTNLTQKPITDFTWLQPVAAITEPVSLTVPNAGISKLSIANAAGKPATLTLKINGAERRLNLAAESSTVIEVAKGAAVTLSASSAVRANLIVDVNFTVANLAMIDYQNRGSSVKVLVR